MKCKISPLPKRIIGSMIFFFALLFSDHLFAQSAITGTVLDNKGAPIKGVSILVKGSSAGTSTAENGSFSITASKKDILVISAVGYLTQEVAIGSQTSVNVSLSASAGQLDEVVVTGYGTQRRKEVTSAITTVSAAQFNKGNINDVAQLLQGK